MIPYGVQASDIELAETQFPIDVENDGDGDADLAVAGDRLLVLSYNDTGGAGRPMEDGATVEARVRVYDNQTGAFVSQFGVRDFEMRNGTGHVCIAAQGDMLYIANYSFDGVDVFNWREGRRVRIFGSLGPTRSTSRLTSRFAAKTIRFEEEGRRIQILGLTDDDTPSRRSCRSSFAGRRSLVALPERRHARCLG